MLKDKLTLVIHSCEKFSDLWDAHVHLLNQNWGDRNINTLLITDKETSKSFNGITIFPAGDRKELPQRMDSALALIHTEFIFITLDDYFLTNKISSEKIADLVSVMEKENLDYIRIFPIPKGKGKIEGYDSLYNINLNENYQVNLYPGLWRKSFVQKTIRESLNAWQYEVSLTKIAREIGAVCAMSKGKEFEILDIVRKGKILNKANRYLKKHHLYNGSREIISLRQELKLDFMFYGKELIPNGITKCIKRFLVKRGHQFYSDVD
ncbi:MAG: hypothetical protein K9L62_11495 [Vallitaleaceae bacterium]|nr:hypothetical protein [Vallitaleaceae bacterium]